MQRVPYKIFDNWDINDDEDGVLYHSFIEPKFMVKSNSNMIIGSSN